MSNAYKKFKTVNIVDGEVIERDLISFPRNSSRCSGCIFHEVYEASRHRHCPTKGLSFSHISTLRSITPHIDDCRTKVGENVVSRIGFMLDTPENRVKILAMKVVS